MALAAVGQGQGAPQVAPILREDAPQGVEAAAVRHFNEADQAPARPLPSLTDVTTLILQLCGGPVNAVKLVGGFSHVAAGVSLCAMSVLNIGLATTLGAFPLAVASVVLTVAGVFLARSALIDGRPCVRAFRAIPEDQRYDVSRSAQPLMTTNMSGRDRAVIIRNIAAIPADVRADVMPRAQELFRGTQLGIRRMQIIREIVALPAHERDDVLQRVQRLITENPAETRGPLVRAALIEDIGLDPANQRDENMHIYLRNHVRHEELN